MPHSPRGDLYWEALEQKAEILEREHAELIAALEAILDEYDMPETVAEIARTALAKVKQ